MMDSVMSLAVTPGGREPSTRTCMFFDFFWMSVWVASTCSTSEVPIPSAKAPNAPCVAVWLSPHTIVIPGCVKTLFRADDVDDALPGIFHVEKFDTEFRRIGTQGFDLEARFRIRYAECPRLCGDVVIRHRQSRIRPPHGTARHPQTFESLRAGDLVHEVAVDIDEAGAVLALMDKVRIPDLVVECPWSIHRSLSRPRLTYGDQPLALLAGLRRVVFSRMRAAFPVRPRK